MPEGAYRIAGPPRKSRFHVFIPIDYPSRADADRGLQEGLITKDVHAAIVSAHREGRLPPQDTPLGGVLGIHGEGTRWRGDLALNWTTGCIAVTDPAIAQLSLLARPGTPVQITP
jgi:murein L,D-transpeptidase YafK